jgi:tetratricopeptide (TPR) repeat protein
MQNRVERLWPILALVGIALMAVLAFPYLASAYYLEAGGRAMDDAGRAEELLNRAIAWDSQNAQAFRLLAAAYERQGNRPAAEEAARRYTELRPRNLWGHIQLAEMYEAMASEAQFGDSERLEAQALVEWQRAGITAQNAIFIAEELIGAGQVEEAGTWYLRATRLEPDLADGWYYVGTWHIALKEPQVALEAYQRGLALKRYTKIGGSDLHYAIGVAYQNNRELGTLTEALSAYEEALALDDFRLVRNSAWAHARRGQLYYRLHKDGIVAEEEILRAVQLAPSDKWLYYLLGDLYEEEGRLADAKAMFEHALHIDPGFEGAQKRLERLQ